MTVETWDTFLNVMNNNRNTVVIDLTKKEEEENESLVNKFDSLFYDIEDLDIQTSYLRNILRLLPNNTLKELIEKIKKE
jgi:hypothetical protein